MAIARKRKQLDVDEAATPGKQTSMKGFAAVSKERSADAGFKRRKMAHKREDTPPAITLTKPTPAKADKKRKRQLEPVAEDEQEGDNPEKRIFRQSTENVYATSPRTKRCKTALPPSPVGTPSKSAAALFDKLKLGGASISFSLGGRPVGYETPPDTPEAESNQESLQWPSELQDLCHLQAAFLSALSMYYAHNGTTSPVKVGNLLPMITKNWKKRAVSLEDLRRLLAVQHRDQPEFLLEDAGRAGVCLSRSQSRGRALKRAGSYIDEDDTNGRFEQALEASWKRWPMAEEAQNSSAPAFVAQLPLAQIAVSASAEKASPLFARGQQRLADLKSAQASASRIPDTLPPAINIDEKPSQAVQSRDTSLLDRVLARQALASSLPAGPTKQQMERKAALHRVEDIARVLGLLVGAKPRVSLSMQAMVQQLQQSLRNPISREEVEQCLELMAAEVMPGFVSLFVNGSVRGVVVRRDGRLDAADVRMMVEKLGG
ncbi:hypothetical protein LTS16_001008 [Friedmanniomyces endolithicus]|uniref:DNA replication factor Cdt1 C-terminal domain-containing protein n=1 Tax=Friedmanniomyces endolithicus TaxID=329885 RepID=A0A4U0VMJ2_9PEZI|nr:hypothetical protein LTS09_012116 [Friedmanniomyces endolithicus]KAK0300312.1 hypothetical protein LTS00_001384 [Friedmanniomyces endolithicus]KAK0324887.1 hypothetical protein LTR82_003873 [Friedmanniomyces endolithicus]KAK0831063.1 hypothetical protein LTR73_003450 [Friedmanniomyces endolithicus]KAK1000082.1 hypothetical protein LTR54_009005 [Friedmanniomyces endolithicus]